MRLPISRATGPMNGIASSASCTRSAFTIVVMLMDNLAMAN
jgi:hypothetical protein